MIAIASSPPFDYRQFYRTPLGVDPQKGRYADVSIDFCFRCWRNWLHYQFEIEGISHSGRWYRGILEGYDYAFEISWEIGPGDAVRLLEEMPWYFAGGSYYGGKVFRTKGAIVG